MTTSFAIDHAQTFDGHGQSGNWSDAANWTGGVLPSQTSGLGLITMATTLNNSFSAYQLMVLGNVPVTINGTLNTLNDNLCNSLMVCAHATVTFSPTSVLNDAGGLLAGINSAGTVIMQGNSAHHAVINSRGGKLGANATGQGFMTVDHAVWNIGTVLLVGEAGQGNLSVVDGGNVHVASNLTLGANKGGQGQVSITGGSNVTVGGYVLLGDDRVNIDQPAPPATAGIGTGTLTVGVGSTLTMTSDLRISAGSDVIMAGGTVTTASIYPGVDLRAGGMLSGYGTLSVGTISAPGTLGVVDNGALQSSGGTLVINAPVTGTGSLTVGANSTLAITGKSIGVPTLTFAGSNGTLSLATGIAEHATIMGFGAGDSILMSGVDHLSWNASTDMLTLSSGTHVVDTLHFAGSYASNAFTLTQSGGHAVIGLASIASTSLSAHH